MQLMNYTKEVDKTFIQLHFSLNENSSLIFNNGMYTLSVKQNTALFLYNPNDELPIKLDMPAKAKYIVLLISINKFHSFFSNESSIIQFLDAENKSKKYYTNRILHPREVVVLNELFNMQVTPSLEALYAKGKVFELISIFFGKTESAGHCPFLQDEDNVNKIIHAKNIITEQYSNPPSLAELAKKIDLPLGRLKEGFKQIYGSSVFNFLLDYKMGIARRMIEEEDMNITEISDALGYSTSSHFIVAFKKKYGATPKQLRQSK